MNPILSLGIILLKVTIMDMRRGRGRDKEGILTLMLDIGIRDPKDIPSNGSLNQAQSESVWVSL